MAEEDPTIQVRGERNRVAGRDYYESPTLVLTTPPAQLRGQLDCAACGQCMLRAQDPGCPRCRARHNGAERRGHLAMIMGSLALVIFSGAAMPADFGPSPINQQLRWIALGAQAFAFAMVIVALGVFFWHHRLRDS